MVVAEVTQPMSAAATQITDVETYIVRNDFVPFLFVRVETDAGVHGIAEATIRGKWRTVESALHEMRGYIIGESPFDTERLFLEMYRDEWYSMNVINTTVISAIDIALWDIKGKLLDRPVYELLGGSVHGDVLRAYANGWYARAIGEDDEMERLAEAAEDVIEKGYDAMKFDPFGFAWERMDRKDLNQAIERIRVVRETVGPDVDILVEGHGRFTPSMAVEVAERMADLEPTWFEEPTPPDNTDGLRQVAAKSPITMATGERHITKYRFQDLIANTDVGVVQPDLLNAGGLTDGKKIAAMAEAEHVSFAPHNPQGPLSTAIYAHIDTSVPNFMIQETFEEFAHPDWVGDLLEGPPLVEAGELRVPDGPGLGVDLNMDLVREHAYGPDEEIDFVDRGLNHWNPELATDRY